MTECRDAELQDLLPDFAADLLDETQAARVAGHVAMCRPCADDLQLLRVVQQLRPATGSLDIARIVAALPAAPGAEKPSIVRDISTAPSMRTRPVMSPRRPESQPARRSWASAPVWRFAAVLGVMLAGALSVMISRDGLTGLGRSSAGAGVGAESVMSLSALPDSDAFAMAQQDLLAGEVLVSYGDLGDYSDEELERMLDQLEQWDGVLGSEPLQSGLVNTVTGGAR